MGCHARASQKVGMMPQSGILLGRSLRLEAVEGVVALGRAIEKIIAQGVGLVVLGLAYQGREEFEELSIGLF